MSLQFAPKSEKELAAASLAPASDYDFEVLQASDEISKKSGNPMIKLKIGLYGDQGIRWHIYDYLIGTMEAKLRHFCDAVGLLAKYEAGTLCAQDCIGRAGKVRIIIQADKSGQYPDKNAVKDYLLRPAKPLNKPLPEDQSEQPSTEDDVPF